MRFSSLLLPLALLPFSLGKAGPRRQNAVAGASRSKSSRSAPVSPNVLGLEKRQRPGELIGVTLCVELGADVDVNLGGILGILGLDQLLGLGVNEDLCICIAGGVLTDASVAQIDALVRNRSALELAALGILDVDAAINALVDALAVLLGTPEYSDDSCGFPDNSIPVGCGTCEFTCADGYTRCGDQCLLPGFCPSNIPTVERRGLVGAGKNADLLCPKGMSACGIAAPGRGGNLLLRGKFECLDTQSDMETCGGCLIPFPGRPQGVDCTALPNVDAVACIAGQCRVQSCEKGYALKAGACVADVQVEVQGGLVGGVQSLLEAELALAGEAWRT